MINITAIILNYNSSKDCEKCIIHLKLQDYKNFNIIIVDNNSSDVREKEKLKHLGNKYNVDIIFSKENKGFSAGNNIGLKRAIELGADWCLIINPDVELRISTYISYMVEEFTKWSQVAVVASSILLPDGSRQNPQRESKFWEELFWPVQSIRAILCKNFNWYLMPDKTGYCEKVSGCCFFIKSEFVIQINFLNENIFMYSEEAILAKQVNNLNYRQLYISGITAYHEHYFNSKENVNKRMINKIESRNYYIENYSELNKFQKKMLYISNRILRFYWRKEM